jgi:hypothetical protein
VFSGCSGMGNAELGAKRLLELGGVDFGELPVAFFQVVCIRRLLKSESGEVMSGAVMSSSPAFIIRCRAEVAG